MSKNLKEKPLPTKDEIVGYVTIPVRASFVAGRTEQSLHWKISDCIAKVSSDDDGSDIGSVGGVIGGGYTCTFEVASPRVSFHFDVRTAWNAFVELAQTLEWVDVTDVPTSEE